MRLLYNIISLLIIAGFCIGNIVAATAVAKDVSNKADGVISVTSETIEYCQKLAKNVDEHLVAPHGVPVGAMEDAKHLRQDGVSFCQKHHVRGGIARLRRALVLLEHSQEH